MPKWKLSRRDKCVISTGYWTVFSSPSTIQAESIQRREELLRDIETANRETVKETYVREKEKAERQEELEQQVRY